MEERSTYRGVESGDLELLSRPPAEVFGAMLAERPVHVGVGRRFGDLEFPALWPGLEGESYLVLSYEGVLDVLRSEAVSSDIHQMGAELSVGRSLFALDPPEHTQLRRLLLAGFTPGEIKRWEEIAIRPAAKSVIDAVRERPRFDLTHDVAETLPYLVFSRILGLPDDAGAWATDRAVDMVRAVSDPMAALKAAAELGEYLGGFVAQRRAKPGDDFISLLIQADVDERGPLSDEEVINFLRHLFLAGTETTFRVLTVVMWHLLRDGVSWPALVADRSLIPAAIEEALRLDPPANYFIRKALQDMEVEGTTIPAGSTIYIVISAANRDPSRWPDPDRFDLHRPPKGHLSFSAGPHTCIGMHLGRRELAIFLDELADAMPELRLDPTADLTEPEAWMLRFVSNIPVENLNSR